MIIIAFISGAKLVYNIFAAVCPVNEAR